MPPFEQVRVGGASFHAIMAVQTSVREFAPEPHQPQLVSSVTSHASDFASTLLSFFLDSLRHPLKTPATGTVDLLGYFYAFDSSPSLEVEQLIALNHFLLPSPSVADMCS